MCPRWLNNRMATELSYPWIRRTRLQLPGWSFLLRRGFALPDLQVTYPFLDLPEPAPKSYEYDNYESYAPNGE